MRDDRPGLGAVSARLTEGRAGRLGMLGDGCAADRSAELASEHCRAGMEACLGIDAWTVGANRGRGGDTAGHRRFNNRLYWIFRRNLTRAWSGHSRLATRWTLRYDERECHSSANR